MQLTHQDIWLEIEAKTLANLCGADVCEFLPIARRIPVRPAIQVYELDAANQALIDLKHRPIQGTEVLRVR